MQHLQETKRCSPLSIFPDQPLPRNLNFLFCPIVPPHPSNMINSNMPGDNVNNFLLVDQAAATSQQLPSSNTPLVAKQLVTAVELRQIYQAKQLQHCKEIIKELLDEKHAEYARDFYKPVDLELPYFSDYNDVIKNPMDLLTIKMKLDGDKYKTSKEFADDVQLVFKNCYNYCAPNRMEVANAKALQGVFEMEYAKMPDLPAISDLDIASTLRRIAIMTKDSEIEDLCSHWKEFGKPSSTSSVEGGSASVNDEKEIEQPLCAQQPEQQDPQQAPSDSPSMHSPLCSEKIKKEMDTEILEDREQQSDMDGEMSAKHMVVDSGSGESEEEIDQCVKARLQQQVPQQADSPQQAPSAGTCRSTNAKAWIDSKVFQNFLSRPNYFPNYLQLHPADNKLTKKPLRAEPTQMEVHQQVQTPTHPLMTAETANAEPPSIFEDQPNKICTRSAGRPKKVHLNRQLQYCDEVIEELMFDNKHCEYAPPFINPKLHRRLNNSKPLQKPMNLRTIKKKLDTGIYKRHEEFAADMRLIFRNCLKFHFPNRQSVAQVIKLQNVFETKYAEMPQGSKFNASSESVFNSSFESEIDVEDNDSADNEIMDPYPHPSMQVPTTCAGTSSSSGTQPEPFVHHHPLLNNTVGLPYLNTQSLPPQTSLFTGHCTRVPYLSSAVTSPERGTYPASTLIQLPQDFNSIREPQPTINFNHNPRPVPVTSQLTIYNPSYPQSSYAGSPYLTTNGMYPVHPLMHSSQGLNPIMMQQSSTPYLNVHRPIVMPEPFPDFHPSTPFLSSAGPSSGMHPANSYLEYQASKLFHKDVVDMGILRILRQTGSYPSTLENLCENILEDAGIKPGYEKLCQMSYQ